MLTGVSFVVVLLIVVLERVHNDLFLTFTWRLPFLSFLWSKHNLVYIGLLRYSRDLLIEQHYELLSLLLVPVSLLGCQLALLGVSILCSKESGDRHFRLSNDVRGFTTYELRILLGAAYGETEVKEDAKVLKGWVEADNDGFLAEFCHFP